MTWREWWRKWGEENPDERAADVIAACVSLTGLVGLILLFCGACNGGKP